jgi:O-antigen ligase
LKWAVLVVALASLLPFAEWVRRHPGHAPKVWTFMGLLPFAQSAVPQLDIAVISWEEWPGFVKGAELSALDLFTLAIYLTLPRARHPLPFRWSMALYFVAVLLSAFQAQEPVAALFYPWQLARTFLVYAVVAKACADPRFVPALLAGMAIGLCFQACIVIWQRFGLGVLQATGTFGHQNLLGLVSNFVVFPFVALLLAGYWRWTAVAAPLAGAIIAALTVSRATAGLAAVGYGLIFMLSAGRRWTSLKALLALIGVVAIMAIAPLVLSSFERRFALIPLSQTYDERAAFESAAAAILADHPLGIGANNFAFFSTTQGYSQRTRVVTVDLARSPHVHNVYWLAAAETGYLGLVAFVLLLLRPLGVAFLCGWRNRTDWRGDLLLGLGMALLLVYTHSFFEWIFFTAQVQYIFATTVGLVGGLAQQLGYWRRGAVRARQSGSLARSRPSEEVR